ncbi:MAG: hypothetical protein BEN18_05720 [Epulopiscium sp. Nuni2H_MBin001]|nr:MAG: hypothetical protein BEN18_05720 [Epulopiscium sp. Nuni2H_MBin001]
MAKFMKFIEKTAKSIDVAVTEALMELRTTSENVDIVILEKGSKGFFGIGAKPFKVRVTLKEIEKLTEVNNKAAESVTTVQQNFTETKDIPAKDTETDNKIVEVENIETKDTETESVIVESENIETKDIDNNIVESENIDTAEHYMPPVDIAENIKVDIDTELKAKEFLSKIVNEMNMNCKIDSRIIDNKVIVNITGAKLGALIGKRGETLESLQYLTQIVINKSNTKYYKVALDVENYRAKRDETLVRLAHKLSEKAIKNNRAVFLEPMNPYDRRIVHSALQDNEFVITQSEGKEPARRVVIKLKEDLRKEES